MTETVTTVAPISARRAKTRKRLTTAAAAVFAERGVHGASVEEICEAAGFTRGAFYSNFADKSELVLAMIQNSIAIQYAAAERAIATMKTTPDRTPEELISTTLSVLEQSETRGTEGLLADKELLLHAAREPALRKPYLEFMEAFDRQLAGLIRDALQHLGLAFTVPFEHAVQLLAAAHDHSRMMAMFRQQPADTALMRSLLTGITRRV